VDNEIIMISMTFMSSPTLRNYRYYHHWCKYIWRSSCFLLLRMTMERGWIRIQLILIF